MLGLEAIGQRLDFLFEELLERRQALPHVVLHLGRFLQQAFFQAREAALVIAHLAAKEDVAYLVDVAGAQIVAGGGIHGVSGVRAFGFGFHGRCPLRCSLFPAEGLARPGPENVSQRLPGGHL